MEEEKGIVNRVANSPITVLELDNYYRHGERVVLDIKDQLHEGLILREKEFRNFIKDTDWSVYAEKFVAITCSADAIVPSWAYMLLAAAIQPFARGVVFGSLEVLEERLLLDSLAGEDWDRYRDKRIVVKGCSKVSVPPSVYVEVTRRLRPLAGSLMFGEPCSTVPVFKKPGRLK